MHGVLYVERAYVQAEGVEMERCSTDTPATAPGFSRVAQSGRS